MKSIFGIFAVLPLYMITIFSMQAQSNEEIFTDESMAYVEVYEIDDATTDSGPTIFDVLKSQKGLATFATALRASGLADKLAGKAYTILAPNDAAFKALPAGALENLLLPENKEKLVQILSNHIFTGTVKSDEVAEVDNLSAWSGQDVPVNVGSAGVFFGEAKVEQADVKTEDGMIHIINKVIM